MEEGIHRPTKGPSSPFHPPGCHTPDPPTSSCTQAINCLPWQAAVLRDAGTCLVHLSVLKAGTDMSSPQTRCSPELGTYPSQKSSQSYSPSGLPFIIFVCFKAETLPEPPLSRIYPKAAGQALGLCPLGQWRTPSKDYACGSALRGPLNQQGCLAFPTGNLFVKGKNSALVSESHREQDKSTCGEKQRNRVCKFCRQLSQMPDISCTSLGPACSRCQNRSFLPFPNLSWKRSCLCCLEVVSTGRSLQTALDFRSFGFTCPWYRVDTKKISLSHLAVLLLH